MQEHIDKRVSEGKIVDFPQLVHVGLWTVLNFGYVRPDGFRIVGAFLNLLPT